MAVEIGRVQATYLVPRQNPQPERVRHKLDAVLERDIATELAVALKPFDDPHDPSVWLVRRIKSDLALDVGGMSRAQLSTAWARQIGRILENVVRHPVHGSDVHYYPDQGAYVADFVADLVSGLAWDRWYYEPFAGLRHLPTSRALCEAIVREPAATAVAIVYEMKQHGQLEKTLSVLQEADAQRILQKCNPPSSEPLRVEAANQVLAVWAQAGLRAAPRWTSGQNQIRLWAAWLDQDSLSAGAPVQAARVIRASEYLLLLTQILQQIPQRETLVSALQEGALGQAVQIARQHGVSAGVESLPEWNRLAVADPAWFDQVVEVIGPQSEPVQWNSEANVRPRGTLCGGLFVLLRDIVELGLDQLLAKHASGEVDGVAVDAVMRYWLLLKCWGQERLAMTRHDWAVLLASGLSTLVTDELWVQAASATSPAAMAALRADFVESLMTQGRVSGQFLALDTVQGLPLVRDMVQGYWLALGETAGVSSLIEAATFAGKPDDAPDEVQEFVLREKSPKETLNYHSWPELPAHIDQTLTLLAQATMRSFARRLIGFAWSSPEHLYRNFLQGNASVATGPERIDVALPDVPLKLVLRMARLHDERFSVPWLDDREIVLSL